MRTLIRLAATGLCACLVLTLGLVPAALGQTPATSPAPKKVVVGVVTDGPSAFSDHLHRAIQEELKSLAGSGLQIELKQAAAYNANWNAARVRKALQRALGDRQVDVVLASGVLASEAAGSRSVKLSKPVVGGFLFDADPMGLATDKNGRSTKSNFTFVTGHSRITSDLEAFHRMVSFGTVHILIDSKYIKALRKLPEFVRSVAEKQGFGVKLVPVDASAREVLDRLGEDAQAVYLTPAERMAEGEWQALIDGINQRRLPSFSMAGTSDVQRGVMAVNTIEAGDSLPQRIALDIYQIVLGAKPGDLPVTTQVSQKLLINARTARHVGYTADTETAMETDFINQEALERGDSLTLEEAMRMAVARNIDLAISTETVEESRQDKNKAASGMLPQISGSVDYAQIDPDRARASVGSAPEKRTTAGFKLSQMIYDDSIVTGYRRAKRAHQGSIHELETQQLDTMAETATAYLQLIEAKALLRTEVDNLKLTQSNLELARVRFEVGMSGPEDVYRWEAQQARDKSSVFQANSRVEQARVLLNQLLGVDQETRWKLQDIELADDDFYFLDNRIALVVKNVDDSQKLRRYSVAFALANDPSLMATQKAIEAQELELARLKRRFGVPSVSAGFQFDHELDRENLGPIPSNNLDDDEWAFGVSLSLPLFEGGGRFADVAKGKATLRRLQKTHTRITQLIERRVQQAFYAVDSSHPRIRLTRISADRAHKNLEVVRDKYARGTVPIIDLLDAQSQAFSRDQDAIIAVYRYLRDLMELQRAIAWFESNRSEQEKEQWLHGFEDFKAGRTAPEPEPAKAPPQPAAG